MAGGGRLEGKVAIVTGGARGQGEATVRAFVAEGCRVILADLRDEEGGKLAAEIGSAARFEHLDVTDEAGWTRLVATVAADYERLDILVNNAGILSHASTLELSVEEFRRVLDVNLVSAFMGTKAAAPRMADGGGGAIVNISSVQGMVGRAGTPAYTASKFGLRGLTKTMALELGALGIRINSVHPGGVETEMIRRVEPGVVLDTAMLDRAHAGLPIPRVGQPMDVALTTLFLVSDEAAYITGTEVVVDGGMLAGFTSKPSPR
jgi:3alpha(or 20beta)-hydroxysteroid dehydrogenase